MRQVRHYLPWTFIVVFDKMQATRSLSLLVDWQFWCWSAFPSCGSRSWRRKATRNCLTTFNRSPTSYVHRLQSSLFWPFSGIEQRNLVLFGDLFLALWLAVCEWCSSLPCQPRVVEAQIVNPFCSVGLFLCSCLLNHNINRIHYLHFALILAPIVAFITIVISLLTPPIQKKYVRERT